MERVFDICHGCRRCFNLCESFRKLFNMIDESPTGELDGVDKANFKQGVDACTLCDMCFLMKCPYTRPHEFNIDFPHLMLRRIALGPNCTFYFESYETLLLQIQEMLLVEKSGQAQIGDELGAYSPLIAQGSERLATVMFEIDDERRRAVIVGELGRVENNFFIEIGAARVAGVAEDDVERTRDDGKTSSVRFLHFRFPPEQMAGFRDPAARVMLGCDHPRCAHFALLGDDSRPNWRRISPSQSCTDQGP
jgi:hypothetical protein